MNPIAIAERVATAIQLGESHFREFKSALCGPPEGKTKRPLKDISTDIGRTLVAFANADGGELLIGVEDDGAVTGLEGFSTADCEKLLLAPETQIHPATPIALVKKSKLVIADKTILYFSVSKSTAFVHLTSDGRCIQRRDLESLPVASEAIAFDRQEARSRSYDREFVDGVNAGDLDWSMVQAVADQIMKGMSSEKCLQYLELAEYGLDQLRFRRAALLLFAKHPAKWHPRLQIRILRVDGDAVLTGEEYNVGPDEVVPGNIITLVDRAWEILRPFLSETRIDKSARFGQRSIYPELACREALLNAIAHRDYSEEGKGIEVYIFRNRLEIKNPGALLSTIRVEDIKEQKGVHQSRNTYVARVLRELGYMRELGEGMRRIYELMHQNELAPPKLLSDGGSFNITLTHSPIYSERELLWLSQFDGFSLDREQKIVVLLGRDEAVFSAQQIWDAVGIVDTEHYRKLVDSLLSLNILVNRVERNNAKNKARQRRIPFREFPRYAIEIPNAKNQRKSEEKQDATKVQLEDIRKELGRIYVGNLPFDANRELLYDLFSPFGEIAEIRLPVGYKGLKGYGFVEFSNESDAEKCISSPQIEFRGRMLTIRQANVRQVKKR